MKSKGMLAVGMIALSAALAPAAQGAVLASGGGTISYVAGQGETNDVVIRVDSLLGQGVLSFTDADANPIAIGGGLCELVNGVGMCASNGVVRVRVNVRDRDDTVKVAVAGPFGGVPTANTLIGGRGMDSLMGGNGADKLKGNNGRDSLRGRMGPDIYRGGRGSDTLQTLDGAPDASISCGPGSRDLIRADRSDPRPKNCELGKRAKRSKKK